MKKKTKDILFGIFGIIFFLGFMCGMLWLVTKPSSISNDFCEDLGYEKATDSNLNYCENKNLVNVMIECDKEKIYNTLGERICLKENKWGECTFSEWGNYKVFNESC